MNAHTLLKDLTTAIDAVADTASVATEAFKVAYSASVSAKVEAKLARMEADTRAAHARYEYQSLLSDARAFLAAKEAA
jgi:hypothetical protein